MSVHLCCLTYLILPTLVWSMTSILRHRVWDIAAQRPLRKLLGHTAEVRGVSVTRDGDACVSCSTDCTVKLWKVPFAASEAGPLLQTDKPVFEFRGKGAFRGIDHHWDRNSFATAGPQVDIWDHERSEPVSSFTWGADSVMSVRFNPVSIYIPCSLSCDCTSCGESASA